MQTQYIAGKLQKPLAANVLSAGFIGLAYRDTWLGMT